MKKLFYHIENYNAEKHFLSLLREKREVGAQIRLWWRDDDVCEITNELKQLITFINIYKIPVYLSVIPSNLTSSTITLLNHIKYVSILQHGYSHKNYAYGKYYNNKKSTPPTLIDLNSNVDVPMYISGLESDKIYDNNIINVNFASVDLLEFGEKYFKTHATNDLNSIHPIYVDYVNAN